MQQHGDGELIRKKIDFICAMLSPLEQVINETGSDFSFRNSHGARFHLNFSKEVFRVLTRLYLRIIVLYP